MVLPISICSSTNTDRQLTFRFYETKGNCMKSPILLLNNEYIERKKYIDNIKLLVHAGQKQIHIGDTKALYGSGKTTALVHLYHELKNDDILYPVWISLDQYSIAYTNTKIQDMTSVEAMIQNFQSFWHMLIDIGDAIDRKVFIGMKERLENISDQAIISLVDSQKRTISPEIKSGDVDISTWSQITGHGIIVKSGDINLSINIDDKATIVIILEITIKKFIQTFLMYFGNLSKTKKVVLIADDFCWIIDQKIEDWFLRLVKGMDNIVVLVARTVTDSDIHCVPTLITSLQLEPFSIDETAKYLESRIPLKTLPDGLVDLTYKFSNGIPLLVTTIADLLTHSQLDGNTEVKNTLVKLLGQRTNKENTNLQTVDNNNLAEQLYRKLDSVISAFDTEIVNNNSQARLIFHVGGIARKFDEKLLLYIGDNLEVLQNDHVQVNFKMNLKQIVKQIPHYSFIQRYSTQKGETTYQFHYLMRARIETYLTAQYGEYVEKFHALIAEYYIEKRLKYDFSNADKSFYARMYRMEDTEWQVSMVEWVYHLGKIKKREDARLQFAKLYFEAFDWWGWYLPFKFCDDLLTVWEQTQPDSDQDFLELFRDFHLAYPTGYKKQGKGDWDTVVVALDNLIFELDLDYSPERLNTDQRITRGQICRYLGDAYRYKNIPEYNESERQYINALEYFEDEWNKMWVYSFLAELYYLKGEQKLAFNNVVHSIVMAKEDERFAERDQEMLSLNYRIVGDIFLKHENLEAAFHSYFYSILHSYIFNFIQNDPDAYTINWYQDTGKHISQALIKLYRDGKQGDALNAWTLLLSLWPKFTHSNIELDFLQSEEKIVEALAKEKRKVLQKFIMPLLNEFSLDKKSIRTGRSIARRLHFVTLGMDNNGIFDVRAEEL